MDEHQVKIALEKYHQFKRMHKKAGDKIDEIACKKYRVAGSIIRMSDNPVDRSSILLDLMEKEEPLIQDYQLSLYFIQLAEQFINTLPEAEGKLLHDKYIRRKSVVWLEQNHYMSRQAQHKLIERRIKHFVART